MEVIDLKLSENTTGEISSDNPAIRFAKSRLGAVFLLFVSLLYPFEAFSANCQLRSAPVCIDSTPCKDVLDPNGGTIKTCLSTAQFPPPGALISTASCWQYKAAYDCMDQASPSYKDTCKEVRDGGTCTNYAEISTSCNPNIPRLSGGGCAWFDVTYQCEIAPGHPYQETVCSSGATCVDANGNPSFCTGPLSQESNDSLGMIVAGQETARQAGTYIQTGANPGETDLTKIGIFKGEWNRCAIGAWGTAPNCCKPDSRGADIKNALIVQELVAQGWNAIASSYLGSEYMYDTLLDKTIDLVEKAFKMMQEVMSGVSNSMTTVNTTITTSGTVAGTVGGVGAAGSSVSLVNISAGIGGALGGQAGGQAASRYAANSGANTGWTGTIGAIGSAAGTVVGTYAGAYAATLATTGSFAGAGSMAAGAICTPCLVVMVIIAMIMSFVACTPEDMKTMMKLGAPGLCHFVGTTCDSSDMFGGCMTAREQYCCFNSRIGRIIQEAAKGGKKTVTSTTYTYSANRICDPAMCSGSTTTCANYCGTNNNAQFACNGTDPFASGDPKVGGTCTSSTPITSTTLVDVPGQIGTWGDPKNPDCAPLAVSDLSRLDFSQIDLSEFIDDVVTKNVPTGAKEATRVTEMTQGFVDANSMDVTATDGILVTGVNTQLPPPPLSVATPPDVPPMGACTVSFKVNSMMGDGTTTGTFSVINCNPDAVIVWTNQSNCSAAPPTSMDPASPDFTSSVVDASGAASFTVTLPPICFAATTPPTQNMWKGVVTLQPHGTLGVIDAFWQ